MLRTLPAPVPAAIVAFALLRLAGTPASLPASRGDDLVLGSSLLDQPPVCTFVYTPPWPAPGETVEFDASASSDPDGTIIFWAWNFGDGAYGEGVITSHVYAHGATYPVSLSVVDNEGNTTTCQQLVVVGEPPRPPGGWNCQLKACWGAVDGYPRDRDDYLGVWPGATDGYDPSLDAKKPNEPLGWYVYAWFARPTWEYRRIMHDWRSEISDGSSKVWGTGLMDTWNVKTNLDRGPSGYFDSECDPLHELEYPIAALVYVSWRFGVSVEPPFPMPPDEYTFVIQYKGGINAKPPGTMPPDAVVPSPNQTWDMGATPYIVFPLWNQSFGPWGSECSVFSAPDTARFKVRVTNPPPPMPTCEIHYEPSQVFAGDVVTFTADAHDPDGVIVSMDWDFGDGGSAAGSPVTHSYAEPGDYMVVLTVTDDDGMSAVCSAIVHVTAPVCFTLAGACWHMITIPCDLVDPDPAAVFRDQNGDPIAISGDLHRYDHDQQRYETYYHWAPTPLGPVTPGDGYWLWVHDDATICYRATPPGEPVTVHFPTSGWYLFGSPRAEDVPVDACIVHHGGESRSFADAANVWVMDPLLFYDPGSHAYASCGVSPLDTDHYLRAFRGYWLYTFVDDVTLEIPPEQAGAPPGPRQFGAHGIHRHSARAQRVL